MARTHTHRVHTTDDPEYIETDDPLIVERGGAISYAIARFVYFIGGLIMGLLAIRFVLVLLGANPNSGFVDFIYTTSAPFVAPFNGIFNYNPQFGIARFEFETLVAILVYGLITWLIARLIILLGDAF